MGIGIRKRMAPDGRAALRVLAAVLAIAAFTAWLAMTLSGCSHAAAGASAPEIVFFYMDDCYKCDRMKEVLDELLASNPGLDVEFYEWYANIPLLQKLARQYGLGNTVSVPTIFVGDRAISGDGRARELALRDAIEDCAANSCRSPLR